MANIVVVGINHKMAPIEIREKFYLSGTERELLLSQLKNDPAVLEAFVLSTCNRSEVYASMIASSCEVLWEALLRVKKLFFATGLKKYFYFYHQEEAVHHILRVAAGLDSLVLGEKQILAQIKDAFDLSYHKGMMGRTFNILTNFVLQTGRKARRETEIDHGGVSISWAAVAIAQETLGTLQNKAVLILGSGKMSSLAVTHLKQKGVGRVLVMNRTLSKAVELAQCCQGTAMPFWRIKEVLETVDVCICSTGSPHYLIDRDLVEKVMSSRPQRQLVCVDISVPRNIAPAVASIKNTFLFSVDDLDKAVEGNIKKRLLSIDGVERIIEDKVEEFYQTLQRRHKPHEKNPSQPHQMEVIYA